MKKIALIAVAAVTLALTTGFSVFNSNNYFKEQGIHSDQDQQPQKLESIGKMFTKKIHSQTYLFIINTTGKDMCLHAKIKGHTDVYGWVPAYANTKEKAVYIYFSEAEFTTKDVVHRRDHDKPCPKMSTSQY